MCCASQRHGKRARLETRLDSTQSDWTLSSETQNSKLGLAATNMQPHPCKTSPSAILLPAVLLLCFEGVMPAAETVILNEMSQQSSAPGSCGRHIACYRVWVHDAVHIASV